MKINYLGDHLSQAGVENESKTNFTSVVYGICLRDCPFASRPFEPIPGAGDRFVYISWMGSLQKRSLNENSWRGEEAIFN